MNKLEKGLIIAGILTSLTFGGFAISDTIKIIKHKPTSKYTLPIGIGSTTLLLTGGARTLYAKTNKKYKTEPEDYSHFN